MMGWTAPTRQHRAKTRSLITTSHLTEPSIEQVTTIGLDLAKNVFQLHGVDAAGNVLLRKQLRRGDVLRFFAGLSPCLVGMEACATAHYWARELAKLGHTVRLMTPAYVKPYRQLLDLSRRHTPLGPVRGRAQPHIGSQQ